MAERAQIFFTQPALGGGEDTGNFLAASDDLGIAQLILRFRNPGNGHFAAFQLTHILLVPFRRYQFVVAPAEETQQVVEKLTYIRGPDVVLEVKLVNSLAEINPEIFLVEHAKISSIALQQVEAVIVKGCRMDWFAEKPANSIAHFSRRGHRIGKGKDLFGLRLSLLDKAGNAVNQDRSFSCTGSGHHQHRPVNVRDGFALAIVRNKRGRMRLQFGNSHRGSE